MTARRGIISLLEKLGKDTLHLKNWRPLSLLMMDNKLFTKVLARRVQGIQEKSIHFSQMGFIKNRFMSDNIMKILQILQHCNDKKMKALLVSYDFEKAFDTVEWECIFHTMKQFNFGPKFIAMMKIVFTKPLACAYNNGYWSSFFSPTRGTRQGCCYSPIIFTLVVEILSLAIRQNKDITGIKIGDTEIKCCQFADDLGSTLIAEESNLKEMMKELKRFGDYSGLKINEDKCVVLKIGPLKDSEAKYYTMRKLFWSPDPINILGFKIHPSWTKMHQENYNNTLEKSRIIKSWMHRNLTVIGKVTVVNSLINSLFSHKLTALPSPSKSFFQKYRSKIVNFIWNKKTPKIAYDKLIQDYSKLGLKLIDLEKKDAALKAAWPIHWKNAEDPLDWFYANLPIPEPRIWECNISPEDVKKIAKNKETQSVPWSIWLAWSKYNYKHEILEAGDILNTMICGNTLIRRKGLPIFDKKILTSNIDIVMDIFQFEENRLLTYQEMIDTFGQNMDQLQYFGLVAAIPRYWKAVLKQCNQHDS